MPDEPRNKKNKSAKLQLHELEKESSDVCAHDSIARYFVLLRREPFLYGKCLAGYSFALSFRIRVVGSTSLYTQIGIHSLF